MRRRFLPMNTELSLGIAFHATAELDLATNRHGMKYEAAGDSAVAIFLRHTSTFMSYQ